VPLGGLGGVGVCRLAILNGVELLQKLVRHEIDGREEIDDALEDADCISDMHPFHTVEA
jgi:hypothetical protein